MKPTPPNLDRAIDAFSKENAVRALRSRADMPLSDLQKLLDGPLGQVFEEITISELRREPTPREIRPVLCGAAYDDQIVELIASAIILPVFPSYIRERVGGPRWKLQKAFTRLVASGRLRRQGVTCNTRYWLGDEPA